MVPMRALHTGGTPTLHGRLIRQDILSSAHLNLRRSRELCDVLADLHGCPRDRTETLKRTTCARKPPINRTSMDVAARLSPKSPEGGTAMETRTKLHKKHCLKLSLSCGVPTARKAQQPQRKSQAWIA